jgi:hypothetical protein
LLRTRRKRRQARSHLVATGGECRTGDTEIGEHGAAARVKQHIARLEIPMYDSLLVRIFESGRNLKQRRHELQVTAAAQAPKITAGSQLHRQRRRLSIALRAIDLEDRRVVESAGDFMFMLERFPRKLTARQRWAQNLQRNFDPQHCVVRAPHFPMAARTELFEQRVAAQQQRSAGSGASGFHGLIICHGRLAGPGFVLKKRGAGSLD